MINWRHLEMFDRENSEVDPESDIGIKALNEFRLSGGIDGVFFNQIGASHEDPEDASTWGPASPADVDWSRFPATPPEEFCDYDLSERIRLSAVWEYDDVKELCKRVDIYFNGVISAIRRRRK